MTIDKVNVLFRKVFKRGNHGSSLGITLDRRFCDNNKLESGDQVKMYQHPAKSNIMCIEVDSKK